MKTGIKSPPKSSISNPALLGQAIAKARRQAKLTQKELCQKTGIAYSTLTKIERGVIRKPNIFIVLRIAQITGLNVEELLNVPAITTSPHPPTEIKHTPAPPDQEIKKEVEFVYFDLHQVLINSTMGSFFRFLAAQTGQPLEKLENLCRHLDLNLYLGKVSHLEFNRILEKELQSPPIDFLDFYRTHAHVNQEVLDVFNLIAKNHRVGLLTNAWQGNVATLIEHQIIPVKYDVIVDSSEIGLIKPYKEIYKYAQKQAQLPPNKILLIDDRLINVYAARAHGWQAITFDRSKGDLKSQVQKMVDF